MTIYIYIFFGSSPPVIELSHIITHMLDIVFEYPKESNDICNEYPVVRGLWGGGGLQGQWQMVREHVVNYLQLKMEPQKAELVDMGIPFGFHALTIHF